ncbi:hypothetical protein BOG92_000545 [Streptomyces sp. WAC00263]|nr:hypothetical protein BOG92_000545 [Streptomyces sp. WAC00263]
MYGPGADQLKSSLAEQRINVSVSGTPASDHHYNTKEEITALVQQCRRHCTSDLLRHSSLPDAGSE